jgi:hypothetical protein
VLVLFEEVLSMSRLSIDAMDSDNAIRSLARERNRNRVVAIGTLALHCAAFGIATTLVYLNP